MQEKRIQIWFQFFIDILAFLVFLRRLSQTKTVPVPVYVIVSDLQAMRYKNRDGDGFFHYSKLCRYLWQRGGLWGFAGSMDLVSQG
jgi:hypothetical protein